MADDQELYRLTSRLNRKLPLWVWQHLPKQVGWPSRRSWLRRAERRVLEHAADSGVTPIGDALAMAEVQGDVVAISASLIGWGPAGRDVPDDPGQVDIVDQPDHGGDR